MKRTLVVTNDFPTRRGGIEAFVLALCQGLAPDGVVVYTAAMPRDAEHDAGLPFPVVRDPAGTLLPSRVVRRRVQRVLVEQSCDRVLFGAAAPLGLLAPHLRAAGARRIVALTHGHETWWARVPGARTALRRIGDGVDTLTYVSEWCRDRIVPALSAPAAAAMHRLAPGVDPARFAPGCGGAAVRARLGLPADRPVVVTAARLVDRKGQDTLLRCWPEVLAAVPRACLLVVGDGPRRAGLHQLARRLGVEPAVIFVGGVPWPQVPAYLDAGNAFALPCRTRLAGLEPEALGIVFLEAQACGVPVVVGRSGGAPETVLDGETGYVVDPHDQAEVGARLVELLGDQDWARAMGQRGRAWVRERWTWPAAHDTLRHLLGVSEAA